MVMEYRDATYEYYDDRMHFYPCLILGVIGPFIHILIWDKIHENYRELAVIPQVITFENPTHKTELLREIRRFEDLSKPQI